jgi:DnaK suppressor protein
VREVANESNVVRAKLQAEKERIREQLSQLKINDSQPMDTRREGSHFGKEDEASESTELEKRSALENRLNSLLREVERALQKMDDGSYGTCDICRSPIDPARMEALPQAILCMNCRLKAKIAQNN